MNANVVRDKEELARTQQQIESQTEGLQQQVKQLKGNIEGSEIRASQLDQQVQ